MHSSVTLVSLSHEWIYLYCMYYFIVDDNIVGLYIVVDSRPLYIFLHIRHLDHSIFYKCVYGIPLFLFWPNCSWLASSIVLGVILYACSFIQAFSFCCVYRRSTSKQFYFIRYLFSHNNIILNNRLYCYYSICLLDYYSNTTRILLEYQSTANLTILAACINYTQSIIR